MKLTKAQEKVIREVVKHHRTGRVASLHAGTRHGFSSRPIKFLIKHGLIKRLSDLDVYGDGYSCYVPYHYWLEITPKGWDHIYKVR